VLLLRPEEREAARQGRLSRHDVRKLVWRRAATLGFGVVLGYLVLWAVSRVI
jgi:hypothetical protein